MISFAQMNLIEPVYVGKLDCIFCMNVLMYFSEERRRAILAALLRCAGTGRVFSSWDIPRRFPTAPMKFESVVRGDCRIYRKPAAAAAQIVSKSLAGGSL